MLCELLGVVILVQCCGVSLQGVIAPCIALHELLGVLPLCGASHSVSLWGVVLTQCVVWSLSLWCCVLLLLCHVVVVPCVVVVTPCAIVIMLCVMVMSCHHAVVAPYCCCCAVCPCNCCAMSLLCGVMLMHSVLWFCHVIVPLSHRHWCWGVTMRWRGLELVCTQSLKHE